ncbi:MAG TPA: aspartate aminotransferase family protein [Microvirga sp.]|jgi:beta-alanine--pyruvate transaminase|nr:aspartate aminotransferase family protein [Microvirga sp.]
MSTTVMPNAPKLDAYWMPFTSNRAFKMQPRMITAARGMYYYGLEGEAVLDGSAGLWCVNAGHGRREIIDAVERQLTQLDFAPSYQFGHPAAFDLADQLSTIAPLGLDRVFFTNSGSESVDTALKIALAYQRMIGQGTRVRLIGRERGYHGSGFGGMSVGGITNNRRAFGLHLTGVDHLRHTHDLARNAFSRGEPKHGVELADDLEGLVALHGADTIAAVIVEPVSGSAGVLVPPRGYLKRLRDICTRHGILLIFDEVITGFGRLGRPFAADYFGVTPDIITAAKGLTNGTIPMGAVLVRREIHDALMVGPHSQIELFHGYTYSGHPAACAAGLATLEIYRSENLLTRVESLAQHWENALHSLRGRPNVVDVRTLGLMGAVEFAPRPGTPTARAYDILVECFRTGLFLRQAGEAVALSPPLVIEPHEIDRIIDILDQAITQVG